MVKTLFTYELLVWINSNSKFEKSDIQWIFKQDVALCPQKTTLSFGAKYIWVNTGPDICIVNPGSIFKTQIAPSSISYCWSSQLCCRVDLALCLAYYLSWILFWELLESSLASNLVLGFTTTFHVGFTQHVVYWM